MKTYIQITGMICANNTGDYVEKSDYDKILAANERLSHALKFVLSNETHRLGSQYRLAREILAECSIAPSNK